MAVIRALCSEIMPLLKHDLDKAEFSNASLQLALSAFTAGDKEKGQQAVLDIYNIGIKKLH